MSEPIRDVSASPTNRQAHELAKAARNALGPIQRRAKRGDHSAVAELRDLALSIIGTLDTLTSLDPAHPKNPEPIRPGVVAAHDVARHSERWPIALHAVKEIRDKSMEQWAGLEVGSGLGIRLHGKKRVFAYDSQAGFALDIFHELEAIRAEYAGIDPELLIAWAEDYATTCCDDGECDSKSPPELVGNCAATCSHDSEYKICNDRKLRAWRFRFATAPPLSKASLSTWASAGRELCREWCNGGWNDFHWPACVKAKIGTFTDENGHLCDPAKAVRDKIQEGLRGLIP